VQEKNDFKQLVNVQCFNEDCIYNHFVNGYSQHSCNLKRIEISENGACQDYVRQDEWRRAKEKCENREEI
jgi:hypothetical protein